MGDFSKSSWADRAFSDRYSERADIYIAERGRLLDLMATLYRHLAGGREGLSVCDLGCGDGIVSEALLNLDRSISATLVDASEAMLNRARHRLSAHKDANYIEAGFDDIVSGRAVLPSSDFFVSSLAIHHLDTGGKAALFSLMHERLRGGGYFINIETVKPPSRELEGLYFSIWGEGMQQRMDNAGVTDETPLDVIRRYTDPLSNNRPDTLESQLGALIEAGFVNVDCFYKNGIFAIYLGQRHQVRA